MVDKTLALHYINGDKVQLEQVMMVQSMLEIMEHNVQARPYDTPHGATETRAFDNVDGAVIQVDRCVEPESVVLAEYYLNHKKVPVLLITQNQVPYIKERYPNSTIVCEDLGTKNLESLMKEGAIALSAPFTFDQLAEKVDAL